jgi:hypothetical protein
MYVYAMGVYVASVSMVFLLDFRNVLTMWYILFFRYILEMF